MSKPTTQRLLSASISTLLISMVVACQVGKGPSQTLTEPMPMPSEAPSTAPSSMPSTEPSTTPTVAPTTDPSTAPTTEPTATPTPAPAMQANAYALTATNGLLGFDRSNPTVTQELMQVTGLGEGELLVGIDFRATDNMLYAVSNMSKIYSIDTETGAATQAGTEAFENGVNGTQFGVDFNPTVDRVRLHSDLTQNLRLHPDTGALLFTDGILEYLAGDTAFGTTPSLVGTAYTNPIPNAESTELYAIDSDLDTLVKLPSPNDGKISTVGNLGVNTSDAAALDIIVDGSAFAVLSDATRSALYSMNLTTGQATLIGAIGAGDQSIIGLALTLN